MPQKGNISIGYQECIPIVSSWLVGWFSDAGLVNLGTQTIYCTATVQLPHGATITNVTCYFNDWDSDSFYFDFIRQNQTASEVMTYADYDGPGSDIFGLIHISASTINYAIVDNNNYFYSLIFNLPFPPTIPTTINSITHS